MLSKRTFETDKLFLKRVLNSKGNEALALELARSMGDEAVPWLIEWYTYKGSDVMHARCFAALTQLPRDAVSTHLLSFLHAHPTLSENELIRVLNLADSFQIVSVPVSILRHYATQYPTGNLATMHAARSLCDYGNPQHAPLIHKEMRNALPKVNFTPKYWFSALSWYVIGLLCLTCYILPFMIYFGMKRIKNTQRLVDETQHLLLKASDAFIQWQSYEQIGILAVYASSRLKDANCLHALVTLLKQLGPQNECLLKGEELQAMLTLLGNPVRDSDKIVLIQSAPYWGNDWVLSWMKRAQNQPISPALKQAISETLPVMEKTLQSRVEKQILLRSADLSDGSTLMRAPEAHPEIPNEQLLRIKQEEE